MSDLLSEVERIILEPPHITPPSDHTPLPYEILAKIASYLDKNSALSFLLVAKAFVQHAEPLIWRHLDLYFKPFPGDLERYWMQLRMLTIPTRLMRERVKEMLRLGNQRRWKMVKSMRVTSMAGVGDQLINLVEHIAPTVERLHLLAPISPFFVEKDSFDTRVLGLNSDLKLCGLQLSFDSLTHMRIEIGAFRSLRSIYSICQLAPNLHHVELAATVNTVSGGVEDLFLHQSYDIYGPTAIRHLAFVIHIGHRIPMMSDESDRHIMPILDLIDNSPNIQKLGISIRDDVQHYYQTAVLISHLRVLKGLTHLQWDYLYFRFHAGDSGGFEALRVMCMPYPGYGFPVGPYCCL